jgi:hypothetical protein
VTAVCCLSLMGAESLREPLAGKVLLLEKTCAGMRSGNKVAAVDAWPATAKRGRVDF